ncbi:MAG TPA: hypothetical protein VF974_08030 [Patescibacteria group bacterium]
MSNISDKNELISQLTGPDLIYVTAPTRPLSQLKTPLLTEEAKEVMLKHGCTLEENPNECMVFFPEGTTRTELFPRMMTERYHITLPDSYKLHEVYDKYREMSILLYSRE